jgi:hypothetical protein
MGAAPNTNANGSPIVSPSVNGNGSPAIGGGASGTGASIGTSGSSNAGAAGANMSNDMGTSGALGHTNGAPASH